MGGGEHEYNVYLCAAVTDEILVEAKNRYEAEETAKEIFLEQLTEKQAVDLIKEALEAEEVEES